MGEAIFPLMTTLVTLLYFLYSSRRFFLNTGSVNTDRDPLTCAFLHALWIDEHSTLLIIFPCNSLNWEVYLS